MRQHDRPTDRRAPARAGSLATDVTDDLDGGFGLRGRCKGDQSLVTDIGDEEGGVPALAGINADVVPRSAPPTA